MDRRCMNCMNVFHIPEGHENERNVCPFCGFYEGTAKGNYLVPGTILKNRYQVGTEIGRGGFSIVYKAWDFYSNEIVAIKEFFPTNMVNRRSGETNIIFFDEKFVEHRNHFIKEARTMAQFRDCESIVKVTDFFEENVTAYLVMEYLCGKTLKDKVETEGVFSEDASLYIIDRVMNGLRQMHAVNVIHRDINPANIFLTENGVKIIDFGNCRLSDSPDELDREIIVTPGYAPAEQYSSPDSQGPWTDVYAVSATMYFMLTGRKPSERFGDQGDREDELIPVRELNPYVSERVNNAIMRGMVVEYTQRLKSIDQLEDALLNRTILSPEEEDKRRRRKRVIVASSIGALFLIGVFAAMMILISRRLSADITVWIAYEGDEKAAREEFDAVSEMFRINNTGVNLDVRMIPKENFAEEIQKAEQSGKMPTVFMSDDLDASLLKHAGKLDGVYDELADGYYLLDEYRKENAGNLVQLPMGYDVPVVYAARSDEAELSGIDALAKDHAGKYYISTDDLGMYLNSYGGDCRYLDRLTLDGKARDMIDSMVKSENKSDSDQKALARFKSGKVSIFLGGVNDWEAFGDLEGRYEVKPISSSGIYAKAVNCWSISDSATGDEKEAVEKLLVMMMSESGQNAMHIQYKNALPLNKKTCQEYLSNNQQVKWIDNYRNSLHYRKTDSEKETEKLAELRKVVIAGKEKTVQEFLDE